MTNEPKSADAAEPIGSAQTSMGDYQEGSVTYSQEQECQRLKTIFNEKGNK